jgi:hypothetical protein
LIGEGFLLSIVQPNTVDETTIATPTQDFSKGLIFTRIISSIMGQGTTRREQCMRPGNCLWLPRCTATYTGR